MSFSIGSIDPFKVETFQGFDYPETTTILVLLENAVGSSDNAVVQASGLPFREAQISGTLDGTDAAALRAIYEAQAAVAFVDDAATSYNVLVRGLSLTRIFVDLWTYSCSLLEVP